MCDTIDPAQVEALRTQLPGSVGVLVNCAGGNTGFHRTDLAGSAVLADGWRANLDADLLSAVLMTSAVLNRLTEGAAVISIGLIAESRTGRPGTPDDVAGEVTFLASPAARQITGQVLAVNGGLI